VYLLVHSPKRIHRPKNAFKKALAKMYKQAIVRSMSEVLEECRKRKAFIPPEMMGVVCFLVLFPTSRGRAGEDRGPPPTQTELHAASDGPQTGPPLPNRSEDTQEH
jgi:hypothetical protein